ncbi:MAG: TonB-dependent receptor plug domain-containing protein [Bacteroidota bacterium]
MRRKMLWTHLWVLGCLFLCLPIQIFSQASYVLSGYLLDQSSQERLIGGSVSCPALKIGSYSDEYGFFSLQVPTGSHQIQFGAPGFRSSHMQLEVLQDTLLRLYLESLTLEEVSIVAEDQQSEIQDVQMSRISLSAKEAQKMPNLAGEVDILKVMQLMPGVQGGNEGNAGLYVRGGGADQNLILLDGVPIYNPSHLFGFLSNFNSDAISHIDLIKGGFPAQYGGRLSSILDVRLKDGNMNTFKGVANLGLLSSKITLEGPFKNKKASYVASARYSYPDIFLRPISRLATQYSTDELSIYDVFGYQFYDVSGKINYRPNDNNRIQLSVFHGQDRGVQKGFLAYQSRLTSLSQEQNSRQQFGWSNTIGSLQWHHIYSPRWSSNVTTYVNRYRLDNQSEVNERIEEGGSSLQISQFQSFASRIQDVAAKADFFWNAAKQHDIRLGVQGIYHEFLVGRERFMSQLDMNNQDTVITQPLIPAVEPSAYIEDVWNPSRRLHIRLGVHATAFLVRQTEYYSLQPRVAIRWKQNDRWSLKASWANMTQYLHMLTNSGVGLPTDLWVPPTEAILPQQSWQAAIGTAWKVDQHWMFSMEGYYKYLSNTLEYKEGTNFVEVSESWESQVTQGQGWSYGIEALLRRTNGILTGWLGYTLSWAERQSDELNFGETYPYKFDRRHDIGLAVMYQWRKHIHLSANWAFGSGNVTTLPSLRYAIQSPYYTSPESILHYEGRNNYRVPAFHRLDLSISFSREKKRGIRVWSFGLYNAYNRQNPFYLEIRPDFQAAYSPGESQPNFLWQQSIFPILPSVSYRFTFGS